MSNQQIQGNVPTQPPSPPAQPPATDGPSFQLPVIPPQPPLTPPTDAAEFSRWQTLWHNYRWAVQMHNDEACRQGQAAMRVGLIGAIDDAVDEALKRLLDRPKVTKADVVVAMMPLIPVAFRSTELNWTQELFKAVEEVWERMKTDPEIKVV